MKKLLPILLTIALFSSCASKTYIRPVTNVSDQLSEYAFCYIIPTGAVVGNTGVLGNANGVYGGATRTINPADILAGYLMKEGYAMVPDINLIQDGKVLVVSYGAVGNSYVIVQLRDSKSQTLIASSEVGDYHTNNADAVQVALTKALDGIYHPEIIDAAYKATIKTKEVAPHHKIEMPDREFSANDYYIAYLIKSGTLNSDYSKELSELFPVQDIILMSHVLTIYKIKEKSVGYDTSLDKYKK